MILYENGRRAFELNISLSIPTVRAEAVFNATGLIPEYTKAKTPFLEEEAESSPHRAPYESGPFVECPNCLYTIPEGVADERKFPESPKKGEQHLGDGRFQGNGTH